MDSSAFSELRTSSVHHPDTSTHNSSPSKLKTYGFIIAIIVGIGGLAVGGAGGAGYFHVGALGNMAQIDAIIMMAVGGGGGIILLIVGIAGTVKNRKSNRESEISSEHRGVHSTSDSRNQRTRGTSGVRQAEFIERTSIGAIRGAQHFGKAQWETYFGNVGEEPPLPGNIDEILNSPCPFSGDESIVVKDTHMLVLIPATVNGEALTLNKLQELIQNPQNGGCVTNYTVYGPTIKREHGKRAVDRSHWVLMTRDVIPESGDKTYNDQKELVRQHEGEGYVVPNALEAAVCILMEHASSGNKLFSRKPLTHTHCAETVFGLYPVVVGGFLSSGLMVNYSCDFDSDQFGIAALRKF